MLAFHCSVYGSCKCVAYPYTAEKGPVGGFEIGGASAAGSPGNGEKLIDPCSKKPGPVKLNVPNCWPVSKNTPPPPRTTVSHPCLSRITYAAPSRGAKLYHVVCQRGV